MKKTIYVIAALFVCLFFLLPNTAKSEYGYESESDLIEVMFSDDAAIRLRDGSLVDINSGLEINLQALPADKSSYQWLRFSNLAEERLEELRLSGQTKSGRQLYDMNNIYRLRVENSADIWQLAEDLEAQGNIIFARPVPRPVEPPLPPNYEGNQGYLFQAELTPTGVDAVYSWDKPGGDGSGVTICDLEYDWNYNHADVVKMFGSQINAEVVSPFNDNNHGTAVAGEMVSDPNGWGTTGICYGADFLSCGTYYGDPPAWNVGAAILLAVDTLEAGDAILLEQQWGYGPDDGSYVPVEWWGTSNPDPQTFNSVYAAIETAVANGIHVVQAGGNGSVDTDNLVWYGNSGAIIVGAGGSYTGVGWPEGDLQKLPYSSYGSRFDLQGWGENVYTTGYGGEYSSEGPDYYYTSTFAGTSSASPIVTGALACLVGYWKAMGYDAADLSPDSLRTLLKATGTAQITPPVGNIGPRPDIRAAIGELIRDWQDAGLVLETDSFESYGAAWGDYDNDGDEDLYLTNNGRNLLLRNDLVAGFKDVTAAPVDDTSESLGACWADYDNDGDLDLYVANKGANKFFINDNGSFSEAGMPGLNDPAETRAAIWVDYNNDGYVDLYLVNFNASNMLFRNDSGTGFTNVASGAISDGSGSQGAAWGDYDLDGDLDVYLCRYFMSNLLLRNDNGVFVDVTSAPLDNAGDSRSASWGDYDNDGDLDLYLGNYNATNRLYRNDGGSFTQVAEQYAENNGRCNAVNWFDYNNDGRLDLYFSNYNGDDRLLRNVDTMFLDVTRGIFEDDGFSRGAAYADFDQDGDQDMYLVRKNNSNILFENVVENSGHWLQVKLIGTASNSSAIGARLVAYYANGIMTRVVNSGCNGNSQSSLIAEFGLGDETLLDSLNIIWPSGIVQKLENISADTLLTITEDRDYVCGDATSDELVNISDAVYIINFIFVGGSPAPDPFASADANCDGLVNVSDAVWIVNFIFNSDNDPCDVDGDGDPDC